jgi:hypothetical protein
MKIQDGKLVVKDGKAACECCGGSPDELPPWLSEDDVELIDPIIGGPGGTPSCCPNDTGCTTFSTLLGGPKTVDARVRVKGTVTVVKKCGNEPPFTFVENTYSWDEFIEDAGQQCQRSSGARVVMASENWDDCGPGSSSTPQVSFSATWRGDSGLIVVTYSIFNLPNMPGRLIGGGVQNFNIRLRGGDSYFTPTGVAWSNYDRDAYKYNEIVIGDCETQFAASGHLELSLRKNVNRVKISMQISGAIDNVGACP